MRTYVLIISRTFMKSHPRAGQFTFFKEAIEAGVEGKRLVAFVTSRRAGFRHTKMNEQAGKIHTLRPNYDLWSARAEEINAGRAVLSLRQWTGKPYRSKQKEFMRLEKIGVQRISLLSGKDFCYVDGQTQYIQFISKNDGLSEQDFIDWFKKDVDGCVLHFTDFRYR